MMHGPEKSDPAIVAMKPTNKAGQLAAEGSAAEPNAAEPVERRAGTKGNAGQQSTHRTQSRVSVSQELERIRKVARERKKERFTALYHHINTELLVDAFFELAQNAAPGVDRLTWKDYEADLERKIEDLHLRVQRGAYRVLPSRRVYIPKPDGRQRPHALAVFRHHVTDLWRRTLRRRSQKDRMTWERMTQLVDAWLPKPIILHPWPSDRFAVTHPRWEPYAGKPPVRFCAGGAR